MEHLNSFYSLIDSGAGEKLERFGKKILLRPSSVAIWSKKLPRSEWERADAIYFPENGWKFSNKAFEEWDVNPFDLVIRLRLQTNGQIGIFPEHASYLSELGAIIDKIKQQGTEAPKVLNLFAYTGMASTFLAKMGAHVTHIDLSKKVLSWAKENLVLNDISESNLRLIPEDALKFIEREKKRKSSYDLVVVDPPSFSRLSKSSYWKLEDIAASLLKDCYSLLGPSPHGLCISCHDPGIDSRMLANIAYDLADYKKGGATTISIVAKELGLKEAHSQREMPAGSLVLIT